MPDQKKPLTVTLTEPVVFLRTSDPLGRLQSDPVDPPTLVRGILTLNVAKPMRISSIEVGLSGVLAINYPEAIGARRIDLPEKRKIYSSTVTVFRAGQVSRARHAASLGPRLSDEDRHAAARLSSLPRGRSERRSTAGIPLHPGPTPPYTETQFPIRSAPAAPGEHPAETLEELRQALRENLERHGSSSPSSYAHVPFSPTNFIMRSNTSSTSGDSSHRESSDFMHTSSSHEGDTFFHSPTEESPHVVHLQGPSPTLHSPLPSPESTHATRPRMRGGNHDPTTTHSRLRLSLASVLDAVKEITSRSPSRLSGDSIAGSEERERGRPRVRLVSEEQTSASVLEAVSGPGNGNLNASHMSSHSEHREHHLLGLGRILGLERDHEKEKDGEHKSKEHGEQEFKPGTYSFPVSFLLPPHLPPTFSLPNGSLNYTIKGVAHRPGTFTSKLSCRVPLLVVVAPAIGAGDGVGEPGSLFIQQQWQDKLAYSFGLSSRLLLLGSKHHLETASNERVAESLIEGRAEARAESVYGTATLDLTLLPTEKIKIWRLAVFIDQRVRYIGEQGNFLRDDDKRQVKLLEMQDTCLPEEAGLAHEEEQMRKNKHKHKHDLVQIPLLPTPISPDRSPILKYVPPSADPSILAGPGPYTLSATFGLPGCNVTSGPDSGLQFTVKQKASSVRVEHSLRLAMRVENVGDGDTRDHGEGEKKRFFDIAIQTPVTILSCRCVPEYQTLPRYTRFTEDSLYDYTACPCREYGAPPTEHEGVGNLGHAMRFSSDSSMEGENGTTDENRSAGRERSRSPLGAHRSGHANPPRSHPASPTPTSWTRAGAEANWHNNRGVPPPPPLGPPPPPRHAHAHAHGHHHPHHTRSESHSVTISSSHAPRAQTPPPHTTPHQSRPSSPLARYERLVSGLESEAGEAPPSYESVASSSRRC